MALALAATRTTKSFLAFIYTLHPSVKLVKTCSSLLRFLLLAVTSFTAAATTACAQTVITSLPYTITVGGSYVLNNNLSAAITSGSLIKISASNVTIDMQGHFIAGSVGNTTQTTIGISADERSNLSIRNGTIAHCGTGISITGNGSAATNNVDHQIENLRITYCYNAGISVVSAPASRIVNCQISQIGYNANTAGAYGIYVAGAGTTVQGNSVSNVLGSTTACIYADVGSFVRQNQVSNATYGVYRGIYQDNLAHACPTSFSNGTDGGGNAHD